MTMRRESDNLGESATPADLRAVERLLERLGAHERADAPFGLEERIATGTGAIARSLDALARAEADAADAGMEGRVYRETRPVVAEAGSRLLIEEDAPADLEERIFRATRGMIARADQRAAAPTVVMRIGRWPARLAAVLALGGGVWLAWAVLRNGATPARPEPVEIVAVDDEWSFDEFDQVLESHLTFMKTVEYRPADVDLLDEDWCTSCELIELEEEITS